ncbi:MAG: thymidine phosphorylase [Candidatus Kapaibacteriota bacterium]
MKSIKELLKEKRQGAEWSPVDVERFVHGVVDGSVTDAQVGAFLMAACIHGLSVKETSELTLSMARNGASFPRQLRREPSIDKHSTGGVGDKVSLLLAPLAAECGLTVPMISGRGLGHTGGTVDKLGSIVGFRTDLSMAELERILRSEGLVMASQSPELAPADRRLYALRDVTGTVENVGLITASILSKKFAEGLSGLVMDVKVGSGAFMQTLDDARALAQSLQRTSSAAGVPMHVVFTRKDRPLGKAVGNWLEVFEAEQALKQVDTAHPDLVEVTEVLTAHMVMLGGELTYDQALDRVREAWTSGRAWKRFHRMVEVQGGQWAASLQRYAQYAGQPIYALREGFVSAIDPMQVALAVMRAGGGRMAETDVINPAVGVEFAVQIGQHVQAGQLLATVYGVPENGINVVITEEAPRSEEPRNIIDVWV